MRPGFVVAVLAGIIAAGCGPTRPSTVRVTGRVLPPTGSWPASGLLVFLPDAAEPGVATRPGRAVFGTDGRFTAGAFAADDGLVPGRYRVIVQCGEPLGDDDAPTVSHVPTRYGSPTTTDLTLDVPASSRGVEAVFSLRP